MTLHIKSYAGYKPPNRSNARLAGARHRFVPDASLTGKRKHWPLTNKYMYLLYIDVYLPRVLDFYRRWSIMNPIKIEYVDDETVS